MKFLAEKKLIMLCRPLWNALFLAGVTALPVLLSTELWKDLYSGIIPRAWDGSGHYAIATIYSKSVFPDTFGWVDAFYSGMPFPNYYPPLFYWVISLLHHVFFLSFPLAFKIGIILPTLMIPISVWTLVYKSSEGKVLTALCAAILCTPLLVDYRFRFIAPSGLDYVSTFQVGLYTQPLGFVLLLFWLASYCNLKSWSLKFLASSLLLSLVILANFFSAIIAVVFVISFLISDFSILLKEKKTERRESFDALAVHAAVPLIAIALSAFWVLPMMSSYDYFVTKPLLSPFFHLITTYQIFWYTLSLLGLICWSYSPSKLLIPFLLTTVFIELLIVFSSQTAQGWFSLQPLRFLTALNYLLLIPIGYLISFVFDSIFDLIRRLTSYANRTKNVSLIENTKKSLISGYKESFLFICLAFVLFYALSKPSFYDRSYFTSDTIEPIESILNFAKEHRDGHYLVEVSQNAYSGSLLDSKAINSYLGLQGNKTLSVVFRESSPNSLFFNPLISAFSSSPDNFGISSTLADDIDFSEQSFDQHIRQANFAQVKYFVVTSPQIKKKMLQQNDLRLIQDSQYWSIFENQLKPHPSIEVLKNKPALVLTDHTFKLREKDEYTFARFAEEQFFDNWFDVILAYTPKQKIDKIENLDLFGALIVDTYVYDNEYEAFDKLKNYSQKNLLILLSSESPLFKRIQKSVVEFPMIHLIDRPPSLTKKFLTADTPTEHYNQSNIRQEWKTIKNLLDTHKIPVKPVEIFDVSIGSNSTFFGLSSSESGAQPILIRQSFHPNWRRVSGEKIYAAMPFFTLTFARENTAVVFSRTWIDQTGILISITAITLITFLVVFKLWKKIRITKIINTT